MADVLVYVEVRGGKVGKASLEALSEGARIAAKLGSKVYAVALGDISAPAELGRYGAASVFHVNDEAVARYSQDGYAKVLARLAREKSVGVILMAATAQGKDLAPRVASALDSGYAADVVEINVEGGGVSARRPVYAGKGFVTVQVKGVFVACLRPNVFKIEELTGAGEVVSRASGLSVSELKAVVVGTSAAAGGKLDVAEADVIVSGGRGMKGPENWNLIEGLAAALGAATGASRAVVDAGWRPHSEQVGQTGKTVSPKLYVAVGISGAIQHLAGMSSSKCIVAINKDPQAPIFKIADYGIVGDAFEIVPKLIEALKK